jgi:hypothetical protein
MTPKWLQKLRDQRKIKEQEQLIRALKRPENERRRPAAKMTLNKGPR